MTNDKNRDFTVFTPAKPRPVPRPKVWRVVIFQAGAGLILLAVASLWFPGTVKAVLAAALLSVIGHGYFTWRSMRHYGARVTGFFVTATSQGLFGKWIIVALGLVVLWRADPSLNAFAMLLTVLVLNTLAAALAPFLVK